MKEYRNKLKAQNIIFIIGSVALTAVQVLAHIGIISPIAQCGDFADFWNGFIAGVACGLTGIMIIGLIINLRAMNNEEKLKKLYIKENDERTKAIAINGKSAGATAYLFCMIIAAIISGFFSITVFFTILACEVALTLFMVGGKIYFSKKL